MPQAGDRVWVLRDPANEPLAWSRGIDSAVVTTARARLSRALNEFRVGLRVDRPGLPEVARALELVNREGTVLIWRLFDDRNRARLIELFRRTLLSRADAAGPPALAIEAEPADLLPFELLPLFELSEIPPLRNDGDLDRSVRRFPAFSMLVRRNLPRGPRPQDADRARAFGGSGGLRVGVFSNATLRYHREELQGLGGQAGTVTLTWHWPLSRANQPNADGEDRIGYLATLLDTSGSPPGPEPDHVHHFSCHCTHNADDPLESALYLTGSRPITIAGLAVCFARMSARRRGFGPFVVLNACGSGRLGSVASFPELFVQDNRNIGFIGTETDIPETFATAFTRAFYDELLQGRPVGRALYEARWRLLRGETGGGRVAQNPLGLIYALYGEPDLCLENYRSLINQSNFRYTSGDVT
jgi:hypothetical protein